MTSTTKKDDLVKALDEMSSMVTKYHWAFENWQEPISEHIGKLRSLVDHLPEHKCPNCHEINDPCACMRNKCTQCGKPVGNITFTLCDDCWENRGGWEDEKNRA